MSGRPAPPGRKGSVKKEAFKADDETAGAVAPVGEVTAADRQRAEREEEMKKLMALRKKAQEEEQAAAQREQDERKAEAARKRAEETNKGDATAKAAAEQAEAARRLEQSRAEEAKRLAEEQQRKQRKAEEEARAAEERARAEAARAEAARADAARAEAARADAAQREKESQEAVRKQAEQDQARAAKAEAARAAREEAARLEQQLAEKLRLEQDEEEREFAEEQERRKRELEEKRRAREAKEAERQAEQQALLEHQQQLEEQQRRMDEKLARQKALLAETEANEQRENERAQAQQRAEAEERERQRAERIAAKKAAEQAEIDRLRAEEEKRVQELLAAQQREEEAHNEEVRRLELERAAAAEEARKAEEAISQYENAALEEKRRRAEAQRKKREMFLNDMDTFSTTFEAKTQAQDEEIKADQDKHYELLAQQMKEVEAVKASVAAKEAAEKEQRAAALAAAQAQAAAEAAAAIKAAEAEAAANTPPPAPAAKAETYAGRGDSEGGKRDLLGDLTSTLFTASSAATPSAAAYTEEEETTEEPEAEETEAPAGSDELRVPTRIGSGKPKAKPVLKPAPAAVITAKANAAIAKYSEDEEEEGTGEINSISNVLTLEERRKMTLAQKESWRAKQADLTEKRKDFHGVVTYTFDGVFSWQMYGSAEAVDETGSNYTEYLMRCQWGTTFENMQPWIVAHRYREFDTLDQAMKRKFPRLEANMPKLPKKELFRALSSDVVAERRAVLEEYMSKIVSSMPSLLRSELMNDFLDITNRISGIRLMLLKASNKRVEQAVSGAPADPLGASSPAGGKGPVAVTPPPVPGPKSTAVPSNSKYGIEDPLGYNSRSPLGTFAAQTAGPELFAGDTEDEPVYWTLDDAEEARAAKHSASLDEDALGHLETDIRTLGQLLRKGDNKALVAKDSKFRSKFRAVSKRWPNLRATAVVGMGVDFTLIPRAMQAEEDLLRYLNEFRNIETAQSLTSRMTSV